MRKIFLVFGIIMMASPSLATVDYSYLVPEGSACSKSFDGKNIVGGTCDANVFQGMELGEWAVLFNSQTSGERVYIVGTSWCSDIHNKEENLTVSTMQSALNKDYASGKPSGEKCYCKMTDPDQSQWIYIDASKDCNSSCAVVCTEVLPKERDMYLNMVATIDTGGSGGTGQLDYLYDMWGAGYCANTEGIFTDRGCAGYNPDTQLILNWPGQWGVVMENKNSTVFMHGTAMTFGDKLSSPYIGMVADSDISQDLDDHYNRSVAYDTFGNGYCFCRADVPGKSSWVLLSDADDYDISKCTSECARVLKHYYSGSQSGDLEEIIMKAMVSTMSPVTSFDNLYSMLGGGKGCFVDPNRIVIGNCGGSVDISSPGEWAALWGNKNSEIWLTGKSALYNRDAASVNNAGDVPGASVQTVLDALAGQDGAGDCFCQTTTPGTSSWVYSGHGGGIPAPDCAQFCSEYSAQYGIEGSVATKLGNAFINTMKSAVAPTNNQYSGIPASMAYVDNALDELQDAFDDFGNDMLITYTADAGYVGKWGIINTLNGINTSNWNIPTRGAVLAELNTKQNTISSGQNGWAATYTNTAGTLGSKPIYSSTMKLFTSLIDADTVNTAVINAVNGEFTPVQNVGFAINRGDALSLLTVKVDNSLNGTSKCYRSFSGTNNYNGDCSGDTLTYLGATGSKSGKWGAVFPWGSASGISVCSTVSASVAPSTATSAQSETLNTDYATQMGTGELTSGQEYCWCKMENILATSINTSSSSSWVYVAPLSSCAGTCASLCGEMVRSAVDERTSVFGNYGQ